MSKFKKVITAKTARFLQFLEESGKEIFSYEDVSVFLNNPVQAYVSGFLNELIDRELIMRIKGGLYSIIPYNVPANEYFPNWHWLAKHLIGEAEYYIGYYSALSIYNITTQPSLTEQIVVKKRITPSNQKIGKVNFHFVHKTDEKRFFGYKEIWVDKVYRIKCSDLEMTFIDCLDRPDLAGGIVEIVKALSLSKNNINTNLLFEYAKRFNKQVVFKRLGFVLELLAFETPIILKLLHACSPSYSILDPTLPKEGTFNKRWRLQINESEESIKQQLST